MTRFQGTIGGRPHRLVPAIAVAALTVGLAACSGSSTSSPPPPSSQPAAAPTSAPATSAPPAAAAASSSGLSGKWSGRYSGSYSGTFVLRWHQSGSRLSGTIKLSAPAGGALALHGTVHGSSITFGTVGSTAVTYSGSVSGNSMSGTYQVHAGSGAAGGNWSASKS